MKQSGCSGQGESGMKITTAMEELSRECIIRVRVASTALSQATLEFI
jgi:hypothetical protein